MSLSLKSCRLHVDTKQCVKTYWIHKFEVWLPSILTHSITPRRHTASYQGDTQHHTEKTHSITPRRHTASHQTILLSCLTEFPTSSQPTPQPAAKTEKQWNNTKTVEAQPRQGPKYNLIDTLRPRQQFMLIKPELYYLL